MYWPSLKMVLAVSTSSWLLCALADATPASSDQQCTQDIAFAVRPCNDVASDSVRFRQCLKENLTPACLQKVVKQSKPWEPDESCQQETAQASRQCDSSKVVRQCWQERLSPACAKIALAGKPNQADASCKAELQQAAEPCTQKMIAVGRRCLQEHLSQKCKVQVKTSEQHYKVVRKSCEPAMQKLQQVCGALKGQEYIQCSVPYQADLKTACADNF